MCMRISTTLLISWRMNIREETCTLWQLERAAAAMPKVTKSELEGTQNKEKSKDRGLKLQGHHT